MTVKELIEKLGYYDPEAEVVLYPDGKAMPIRSVFGNSTYVYLERAAR